MSPVVARGTPSVFSGRGIWIHVVIFNMCRANVFLRHRHSCAADVNLITLPLAFAVKRQKLKVCPGSGRLQKSMKIAALQVQIDRLQEQIKSGA